MELWIQFIALRFFLWFILRRLLPVQGIRNLSNGELKELLKNPQNHLFIDVREKHEYREGYIKGFKNIPLSELTRRVTEIDRSKGVVLTCRSGMRSRQAAKILKQNGFTAISHLKTGVSGWDGNFTR